MNDPFNFDMSVKSAKKKNPRGRRTVSGAVETSQKVCAKEGCEEAGKYRAPKEPNNNTEYLWFCKEHVREYNQQWNAFESEAELAAREALDRTGDRPTQSFKKTVEERAWARLGIEDAHQVLGGNATQNKGKGGSGGRRLPAVERKAIEILEAKDHWDKKEIRKAYKALIKVLHPDMNGGDRSQEDQLNEVVWAWDQIKDSKSFQ